MLGTRGALSTKRRVLVRHRHVEAPGAIGMTAGELLDRHVRDRAPERVAEPFPERHRIQGVRTVHHSARG